MSSAISFIKKSLIVLILNCFSATPLFGYLDIDKCLEEWTQLCDQGNYDLVLKQQYEILKPFEGYSEETKMKVFQWQEERLVHKFEIPIGWVHMTFYRKFWLNGARWEKKENREKVRILALQMYLCLCMHLDLMDELENKQWLLGLWIDKVKFLFNSFKHKSEKQYYKNAENDDYVTSCSSHYCKDIDRLKKNAQKQIENFFEKDEKVLTQKGSILASQSHLPFPELVSHIELIEKVIWSYCHYANWYTPGITIASCPESSLRLSEIHEKRKNSFYRAVYFELGTLIDYLVHQ